MELNKILKARRNELNLTLLDIAKACNVSEATVSRWESGEIGDMKRSRIASLANVLQMSPAIIVGSVDDDSLINDLLNYQKLYKEIVDNEKLELLLSKAKQLTPAQLDQVISIIDTFLK